MQGIPTDRDLSFQSDVSSFTTDADSSLVNSRTAVIGQAGNAMHSEAVAIVWLFILTQSDKVQAQARPKPRTATASQSQSIDIDSIPDSMDCSNSRGRGSGSSGVAKFFLNKRR